LGGSCGDYQKVIKMSVKFYQSLMPEKKRFGLIFGQKCWQQYRKMPFLGTMAGF
jgi:hypothetical protein